METRIERHRDCLVARPLAASLDFSVCSEFRDQVGGSLPAGPLRLVIDLQDVTFLDSMAIGALVSLYRKGRQQGGRVALCGLNPFVANVLHMVTVDGVFEVYDDVAAAVQAMGAGQVRTPQNTEDSSGDQ